MDKVGVLNFTDDDGSTYVIEISTFSDSEGDKKTEKPIEEVRPSESKKFTCFCCGSQFPTLRGLRIHLKIHGDTKDSRSDPPNDPLAKPKIDNYSCYTCGFYSSTKKAIRAHVRLHIKANEMVCSVCGVVFARRFLLKAHMIQRHSELRQPQPDAREKSEVRRYTCDVCNFTCTRANQFAGHMKTHPKDEPVFDYSRIRSKQIRVYSRATRIKQEPA